MDYRDDLSAISLAHLRAASGWQQQYKLIIQWGKLIAPKPALRIADNLIRGCEVPVWLAHMPAQGRDYFALDADSSVIKGLASLLLVQVNGKTNAELIGLDLQGELRELGIVESAMYPGTQAFMRFGYPCALPAAGRARAGDVAQRFLQLGLQFVHIALAQRQGQLIEP